MITKVPSTEGLSGKTDLTLGNYGLVKARGSINVPLSDSGATRTSISITERDGFSDNTYTGQELDDASHISFRTDWAFDLFNNTKTLLIFSYVVRFGSLAMGVVLLAVAAVPQRLQDAGRTLGVRRGSRFFRIDLPLMTPGLGAAAGLVILSTMKELPITLLISPLGFSTLATRIFSSFEDAFVTEAGIMALVLVLISFLLTWFLVIRKADHF